MQYHITRVFNTVCLYTTLLLIVCFSSCSDLPTSLQIPVFSSGFAIPLTDTVITIKEFLGDSLSSAQSSSQGNVVLRNEFTIPSFRLGDSLSLGTVPVSISTNFNEQSDILKDYTRIPPTNLTIDKLISGAPESGNSIIGSFSKIIQKTLPLHNDVKMMKIKSSTIAVTIKNTLPFAVTLQQPHNSQSVIMRLSTNGFVPLEIPIPAESQALLSNAKAITIRSQINNFLIDATTSIEVGIRSQGTGTNSVAYTSANSLGIDISFENLLLDEAELRLGKRTINVYSNIELPSGTTIQEATIRTIVGALKITNGLPTTAQIAVSFPEIINQSNGKQLEYQATVNGNQSQELPLNVSGNTLHIKPGKSLQSLAVQSSITIDPVGYIMIRGTDAFAVTGTLGPITFAEIKGTLPNSSKKIQFQNVVPISITFPQGLSFDRLQIEKFSINGVLNNNSGLQGRATIKFTLLDIAQKSLGEFSMENIRITPNGGITISKIFHSASLVALPANIKIEGYIEPEGQFTATNQSEIHGQLSLDIPLNVQLDNGKYETSGSFSLSSILQEQDKNIEKVDVLFESKNAIPATTRLRIEFFDVTGAKILQIPQNKTLSLSAGKNYTQIPEKSFTRVSIDSNDIVLLKQAKSYRLTTTFSSDGSGYFPLLLNDYIHIRSSLQCSFNNR